MLPKVPWKVTYTPLIGLSNCSRTVAVRLIWAPIESVLSSAASSMAVETYDSTCKRTVFEVPSQQVASMLA